MKDNLLGKELANGRFKIIGDKPLGKGGFATVYLGIQTQLKRKVAVKVLSEFAAEDEDLVRRFIREAKVVAMFEHPNIIKIFDSGSENGIHYFVMNYLPTTLQQILRLRENRQGLPLAQWLKIASDMSSALSYMHSHKTVTNFIHRDIKPANIMFDESGNAILTDFGLVKSGDFSQLTVKDTVMGTPKYMSPEQVQGDELDHRADIYSLGIVLYEALTGQPPFSGDPLSICHKQIATPAPPLHTIKADIPDGLEPIVMKCIEKAPRKRYQFAQDLLNDLDEWENYTRKSHFSEPTIASVSEDLSETVIASKNSEPAIDFPSGDQVSTPRATEMVSETSSTQKSQRAVKERRSQNMDDTSLRAVKWFGIVVFMLLAYLIYQLATRKGETIDEGRLIISSNPPGASVSVNGQRIDGETPLTLEEFAYGTYFISIQKSDFLSWSDSVHLASATLEIAPKLQPADSTPAVVLPPEKKKIHTEPVEEKVEPAYGSLELKSEPPGANISLNDRPYSKKTNCVITSLKAALYTISFTLAGYESLTEKVRVSAGKQTLLHRKLSRVPQPPQPETGKVGIVIVDEFGNPIRGLVLINDKPFKDSTGEDMQFSGEIELPAGTYKIDISKFEYKSIQGEQEIQVLPGKHCTVKFTLVKATQE
ncbi:serine/threonine protein kinase [candidate division KSB1 bacterium]|nr:serine/threonine protein kinase [candidate division KSB1 bacterium]